MEVDITTKGSFDKTIRMLKSASRSPSSTLESIGSQGVSSLRNATPIDSGITSSSWSYKIVKTSSGYDLVFTNSSKTASGTPLPILIQYGHGTGTGGYVPGIDFINPALKGAFSTAADRIMKEVLK